MVKLAPKQCCYSFIVIKIKLKLQTLVLKDESQIY